MSQDASRAPEADALKGLTGHEAAKRLQEYGPNTVREERLNSLLVFFGKFWAPVPWMLEATIALQLVFGKRDEAIIIAVLLVFNSLLSFVQEAHSNKALALLRKRLSIQARVLRDDRWQLLPAQEIVPGDTVHLRMGDISPADVHLLEGEVLLDQSALTGESLPVEASPGGTVYAGATVKRGETTGQVTATGQRTYFGKTAELVRTAKTVSHLQQIVFTIVKYMVFLDVILVAALLIYALHTGIALEEMIPFVLILLVASVPVALPATFAVATALGAVELVKSGVLITRLSAIEEAAAMDVLCSDKTGTITKNQMALGTLRAFSPYQEDELLRFAALASDDATQDPIDVAIRNAAQTRGLLSGTWQRSRFVPFDSQTKRSEAVFEQEGHPLRVVKGAPQPIAALVSGAPDLSADVERLAAEGYRVLAVAVGTESALHFAGLVALADAPREDSRQLVQNLRDLGVRVVMVTGDGLATARAIATQVGIGDHSCPPEFLRGDGIRKEVQECDVIAGVFPEDKFRLVQALQQAGHITGMTGDGVNDAPALKQAEVGIAVATATDVAKAAASIVLTNPGLSDVVATVETSRRIYQRMLTYTLNKIVKTIEIAFYLSLGIILTGTFVITPLLIVLLLFTNDFVTMSIATDRVSFSCKPDHWRIRTLVLTGAALAGLILVLSFSVFFAGRDLLHLPLPQLQTLVFVMLVFTGQGNVYLVRERRHFWQSRPSGWLVLSSCADIVVVGLLASKGILMAPISPVLIAELLAAVVVFLTLVDLLKVRILSGLGIR
jgi:H+-transporting ATPase